MNLDEVLASARLAQDAIRSLELAKIESHDADELRKLNSVIDVLDKLMLPVPELPMPQRPEAAPERAAHKAAAGEAGNVASPVRSVAQSTPTSPAPVATIGNETLVAAAPDPRGLGQRLGRIFVPGASDTMVAIKLMPHLDGLPPFDKCIAPDDSPINGAHGIFVANNAVFDAVLPSPFESNGWQILKTVRCENSKIVIETVMSMLRSAGAS